MLNRLLPRLFGFQIRGVIHVGAHEGTEHALYNNMGIRKQLFIEAHPETFRRLEARVPRGPEVTLLNIACGAVPGRATMHVMAGNDGASNSLLEPTAHLKEFPDITPAGTVEIEVKPLDDALVSANLRPTDYNVLVMDVQGFELEVLRGSENILNQNVEAVICEIQRIPLYKNACLVSQVDEFMRGHGFERVLTRWMAQSFGDGLYLRRKPGLRLRQRLVGSLGTLAFKARYAQYKLKTRLRGASKPAQQPGAPAHS